MAVTLTGSNGLFTRLGKLFQIAVQVKSFQATLATEIQDALDEFDGGFGGGMSKKEKDEIQKKFEEVGAKVEIK